MPRSDFAFRDPRGLRASIGRRKAPAPTCASCSHWSPYIPGLGECLEPVRRRQDAFMRAEDLAAFNREWPAQPAPDTADTDSCDKHEATHA